MAEQKKPHSSQEGQHIIELKVPAYNTKSGHEETVALTEDDWIRWEIERARVSLERAERRLDQKQDFRLMDADELSSALIHVVWAWCRKHLEHVRSNNLDVFNDFEDRAPQQLVQLVMEARDTAFRMRHWGTFTPSETAAVTRVAVDAVIESVSPRKPDHE